MCPAPCARLHTRLAHVVAQSDTSRVVAGEEGGLLYEEFVLDRAEISTHVKDILREAHTEKVVGEHEELFLSLKRRCLEFMDTCHYGNARPPEGLFRRTRIQPEKTGLYEVQTHTCLYMAEGCCRTPSSGASLSLEW
jgi:hypothetical protein